MHNDTIKNSANNKSQFVGWLLVIQVCVNWKVGPNLFLLLFSSNTQVTQWQHLTFLRLRVTQKAATESSPMKCPNTVEGRGRIRATVTPFSYFLSLFSRQSQAAVTFCTSSAMRFLGQRQSENKAGGAADETSRKMLFHYFLQMSLLMLLVTVLRQ